MTNKQLFIIVGAVILAGCLAAFGPSAFASSQQAQRDASGDCHIYRMWATLNSVRPTTLVDRLEEERQRRSGGCSPHQ